MEGILGFGGHENTSPVTPDAAPVVGTTEGEDAVEDTNTVPAEGVANAANAAVEAPETSGM